MKKTTYSFKISKDQSLKMERKARREADIDLQTPHYGHKVHKTKKDYNRNEYRRELRNLEW